MAAMTFDNYIDGEWRRSSSGATFENRNPARLSEPTGCFQASTSEDALNAIVAAQKAYPRWRALTPADRAEMLSRVLGELSERRDSLGECITLENGKTLRESLQEVDSSIKEMEYQIHQGHRMIGETIPSRIPNVLAFSRREPLGVVSVVSPWNYPLSVLARKCTPALMAGNTCVVKPASLTALVAVRFAELVAEAGVPAGVFNLVTGSGREVGDPLVSDARVRAISFTGSTEVGKGIQLKAARTLARTQLELGGKNPTVVLEDADLQDAANGVALAAFACAGQWCTSTSRAIVVKEVADKFTELLLEKVRGIKVGDGLCPDVDMGPVCGTAQHENILRYIAIGKAEGARLLAGGSPPRGEQYDDGCYIAPTVFDNVTPSMCIAREEIFGPVLSIISVDSFAEAVHTANATDFGLSSSIYTRDLSRAIQFVEQTEVGLTHVNQPTALKEPQLSFGGVKESGHGLPEAGDTGIEFFTQHKVAYIRHY